MADKRENGECPGGRQAPAVHIPRQHQSAPEKTWADKEVEAAAEDIRTGRFKPVTDEEDFVPVLLQRGENLRDPRSVTMGEVTGTEALLQHPKVQAAMRQLEREKSDARNSQEALEKAQMLYELNEEGCKQNHWNGQERWRGKEAEEMRIGLILTPFQFMERLERVIGLGRVFMNGFAVAKRVALMAKNPKPAPMLWLPNQPEPRKDGLEQVGTLQWPCGTEWMIMRFDEYGVPTTAKYLGWRTALLSMIQLEVITEKEAHKAFPMGSGPAAAWYKEQLFIMRSQKGMVN